MPHLRPLAVAALLAGCPPVDPVEEPTPAPNPCADREIGATEVFATGFDGTEGLTFSPDGRLFVSDSDTIAEVFADGTWAAIATVPASIGLAWRGDELLVASSDDGVGGDLDGVWSVDVDAGTAEPIAAVTGANFITVTPWGTLLLTDPNVDAVLQWDGAVESTWIADHTSPNGAAFTPDGGALWLATTYADVQPVWRVPVSDGAAGAPEEIAAFGAGDVGDGIALGSDESLYVTQNIGGRIDRVDPDGTVAVISAQTPWAASAAFGVGSDWDACSLYVTSLFSGDLFRVQTDTVAAGIVR